MGMVENNRSTKMDMDMDMEAETNYSRNTSGITRVRLETTGMRSTWRQSMALTLLRSAFTVSLVFALLISPADAAWVNYKNCLPSTITTDTTSGLQHLQWQPWGVWVVLNQTNNHSLNMTVFGNVTGQFTQGTLPASTNQSYWDSPNNTFGKFVDLSPDTSKYTTLFGEFNVLAYTPWNSGGARFCDYVINGSCPLGPVFQNSSNVSSPADLPAFSQEHTLGGSYGFTTINPRLWVVNGDEDKTQLACVVAEVTPYLGTTVENLLSYLPLLVLILVGIATASAAIFSPWGTWDIFRWTSNYGRDNMQLRLITPGFGDCLQYLQFIILSGSLSLHYPGFYQPAVSQVSWSALMFNESFVSHGDGFKAVVDGVYVANGTYGLQRMSQLVGMTEDQDMWAGMMIWLLAIILALTVLVQIGFAVRWLYRLVTRTQEEDKRAKNFPFTAGNAVRVGFNYFLLPIITLSMYQLVITAHTTTVYQLVTTTHKPMVATVAFAAVTIVGLLAFSGWLLRLIISARPRSWLFDDLPTLLLYGPLYNTYSDNAATFALVPIVITFLRGIAIGAVQPSGIAQIILLAICEIVTIMTLNAFRPFSAPTSMNAYHTIFSVVRLVTILLMIAFVPSLGIEDAARGWIGYVILLLHGIALFVGFFLHSLQTGIEVIARLAGAGGEGDTTAMGGFVRAFGVRQLSRRNKKPSKRVRESMASNSTMLEHQEKFGVRSRSVSASSNLLLQNRNTRQSMTLDSVTGGGHSHSGSGVGIAVGQAYTPTTPGGGTGSVFSYPAGTSQAGTAAGSGALAGLKSMEPADPYFRAPRPRRVTIEQPSPVGSRDRGSWASGDWSKVPTNDQDAADPVDGPSVSGRGTPLGGVLGRERADSNPDRPKTDYATREVDYYYGVRGPALSHMPTRKLKTGPADPTGTVSSATGWFKGLFGGKTKEQGKGFEVIRSSRMPPQEQELQEKTPDTPEPYLDSPDGPNSPPRVKEVTRHFELEDEGDAVGGGTRHLPADETADSPSFKEDNGHGFGNDGGGARDFNTLAPVLPDIETGSSIHMPSRMGSQVSSQFPSRANTHRQHTQEDIPEVPRKSSKRDTSGSRDRGIARLSVIPASPADTPQRQSQSSENWPLGSSTLAPSRLPFGGLSPHAGDGARAHNRSQSGDSRVSALSSLDNSTEPEGSHTRHSSTGNMGGLATAFADDRPSSMGYVQQHRASDNVHIVNPTEQTLGSTAELVDGSVPSREASSDSGRTGPRIT